MLDIHERLGGVFQTIPPSFMQLCTLLRDNCGGLQVQLLADRLIILGVVVFLLKAIFQKLQK